VIYALKYAENIVVLRWKSLYELDWPPSFFAESTHGEGGGVSPPSRRRARLWYKLRSYIVICDATSRRRRTFGDFISLKRYLEGSNILGPSSAWRCIVQIRSRMVAVQRSPTKRCNIGLLSEGDWSKTVQWWERVTRVGFEDISEWCSTRENLNGSVTGKIFWTGYMWVTRILELFSNLSTAVPELVSTGGTKCIGYLSTRVNPSPCENARVVYFWVLRGPAGSRQYGQS